jgi:hypothetical protein
MFRRRFRQTQTLEQRLAAEATRLRAEADKLPHGVDREDMLRKARQTEIAAHMYDWITSPGLRPPQEPQVHSE